MRASIFIIELFFSQRTQRFNTAYAAKSLRTLR